MRSRQGRRILVLLAALGVSSPAYSQPYASFAVPDSALPATLTAGRNDYENVWNALFVSELRAKLAKADSAARLFQLEQRVAKAEPAALGSHIGADALALRAKWKPAQQRLRVEAGFRESLAVVARSTRQWAPAESLFRASLADYRALGEKRREAWVLGSIGALLLTSRQTDRALEAYGEALTARRALGDPRLLATTLGDLGQTYLTLQRNDEAIVHLREAAEIRERAGLLGPLGRTLNFLGIAFERVGRPDTAEVCFRRGIALSSGEGDSVSTYAALNGYGNFLSNAGRLDEAIQVLERAVATARFTKDARRILDAEINLADVERIVGRFTDAERRYERALAMAADPATEADIRSKLGFVLYQMGDADRATAMSRRGLALADSLTFERARSRCYSTLSNIAVGAGDLNGALDLAARALAAATASGDSSVVLRMANDYGDAARAARRYGLADSLFARAAAAMPAPTVEMRAGVMTNQALVRHQMGQLDEAEREYARALALAEQGGLIEAQSTVLTNLGDISERRGQWDEAFARYGQALALLDSVRELQTGDRDRVKLQASQRYVYEAVIHLLTKRHATVPDSGYGPRAFVLAERARARALLDLVAASRGSAQAPDPLTLEAAGRLLPKTTALLEYSTGDSSTTLWVVRRDRWQVFQLPPRTALRARIQSLLRALADPSSAEGNAALTASNALYRALIAPAEALLEDAKVIVISPDGALATVPFEALLMRKAQEGSIPKGAYLAERFTVSYVPSATAMSLARPRAGGDAIFAVANPAFPPGPVAGVAPLDSLPGTGAEVAALRHLAGTRPMRALEHAAATRSNLLGAAELKSARLVHIATHGDANAAEPERSGLWLSPEHEGEPPSRVEVRDVTPLRISADLVTLSACESGLGRIESGEGVIGLARGFLVAGCRSVVVSLWKVNDASTAQLMEGFYREWLAKGRDRATALTAAKRELMKKPETRSPFHWAPFVLIGDPAL